MVEALEERIPDQKLAGLFCAENVRPEHTISQGQANRDVTQSWV